MFKNISSKVTLSLLLMCFFMCLYLVLRFFCDLGLILQMPGRENVCFQTFILINQLYSSRSSV